MGDFVSNLHATLARTAKPCHQRIVMGSDLGKVKLPADARLVGMSEHFDWSSNDIAYKFESARI